MNYFICGFSGAGKSYLLKQIEQATEFKTYNCIDLDFIIDQKYAANFDSLGDMIEKIGFEAFRKMELSEIASLHNKDKIILALGGGALNHETLPYFKDWKGLWLDTSFETCFDRIKEDPNRPLVKMGEDQLREIYDERFQLFKDYQRIQEVSQVIEIIKN